MIQDQLSGIGRALRCNFRLFDQPLSVEQVFSDTGLLPPLMRKADQLSMFCLGYGLGVTFEPAQGAMTGVRVKFDQSTPNTLRMLCVADALIELMQQSPPNQTVLDSLMHG